MTVRRSAQRSFDADEAGLAEIVREVLREDPTYRDTTESVDGNAFETIIKPNPLIWSTGMRVRLERDERVPAPRTVVDVTTVSQPFGHADPFGHYDRYIGDFFGELERRIAGPHAAAPRRTGLRGLIDTWHGRWTLASIGVLVALFVALPAAFALAGLDGIALSLLFYPFGAAAGFALVYLTGRARRRFGLAVAVPVAVLGFVAAFAILLAVGLAASWYLLPEGATLNSAGGLFLGIVLAVFVRSKPEGFEGEVSQGREIRGPRGLLLGWKRWLVGGPLFRGNPAVIALSLLGGLPFVALGVFTAARGVYEPAILALVSLGLGNVLLGAAETLPMGPRWANPTARVAGLLAGLVAFPMLLIVGA